MSVLLRNCFLICLVFLHFHAMFINAWPTLQVTILNHTQTSDSKYVQYDMVPSNVSGAYDVFLNVFKENLKILVKLGVYFENIEFMNKTINLCKVAKSKSDEPLLKLIFKVLTENPKARVPTECPIKKGLYYNFILIETNKIPPVWPENKVSIHIDVYSKESKRLVLILSQSIYSMKSGMDIKGTTILVIVCAFVYQIDAGCEGSYEYKTVNTKYGDIRGCKSKTLLNRSEIVSFIGIPYAQPPLGALRFEQAIKPNQWNATLDTLSYKAVCMQMDAGNAIGDEDCLYLNVFTPDFFLFKPELTPVTYAHYSLV
ncbi:Pyrethroid hydrolase Ces2a [Pseudolycoriella hygida]|uniref:Pyrethroid hydrolase Ces2a n=1 Tax=Pseudolycoriella hygida TaxID=35572 RepID=A0A9Q0S3K5_9DIPT|nr:Pyrethroid hydrolase Ces2a [Pseudolycoriella hygida]